MHIIRCFGDQFQHVDLSRGKVTVVCDRHIDSCVPFIEAQRACGYLTDFGAALLREEVRKTKERMNVPRVSGIFYVDTDLQSCLERIERRRRPEEGNLVKNDAYMRELRKSYENYLASAAVPVKRSEEEDVAGRVRELRDFIATSAGA